MAYQKKGHKTSWYLTARGKTQSLADWSRETGIGYNTLKNRIKAGKVGEEVFEYDTVRSGTSKRDVIATINDETKWLSEWAREYQIERATVFNRYERGVRGEKLLSKQKVCTTGKYKTKDTLCWRCGNFWGGCSWSAWFVPVEGWTATPTYIETDNQTSYHVTACPGFVRDRPLARNQKNKEIR